LLCKHQLRTNRLLSVRNEDNFIRVQAESQSAHCATYMEIHSFIALWQNPNLTQKFEDMRTISVVRFVEPW
jgi:hypothetical protein